MKNPPALEKLFSTLNQSLMDHSEMPVETLAKLWMDARDEYQELRAIVEDFFVIHNIKRETQHLYQDQPRIARCASKGLDALERTA